MNDLEHYKDLFTAEESDNMIPVMGFRMLVFYDGEGNLGYRYTQDQDEEISNSPISTLIGVLELVKTDISIKASLIGKGYVLSKDEEETEDDDNLYIVFGPDVDEFEYEEDEEEDGDG